MIVSELVKSKQFEAPVDPTMAPQHVHVDHFPRSKDFVIQHRLLFIRVSTPLIIRHKHSILSLAVHVEVIIRRSPPAPSGTHAKYRSNRPIRVPAFMVLQEGVLYQSPDAPKTA